MNIVRQLRQQAGVTQKHLAARANTSQATISAYESGKKSPTINTVQRLAAALGLELFVQFAPRMTREDRRSLAFHTAIARILSVQPGPTIARARQNLEKMQRLHPHACQLLNRWETWLELPCDELIDIMLDPGLTARDMRQVSPFAGVLDTRERTRVLKSFREEFEA